MLTRAPRFPSTSKSSNPRDTWLELRLHVQHTNPVFYIILFNLNIYPWLQCITRVSISNFYFYLFTVKLRKVGIPPGGRRPSGSHTLAPAITCLVSSDCYSFSASHEVDQIMKEEIRAVGGHPPLMDLFLSLDPVLDYII